MLSNILLRLHGGAAFSPTGVFVQTRRDFFKPLKGKVPEPALAFRCRHCISRLVCQSGLLGLIDGRKELKPVFVLYCTYTELKQTKPSY